MAFLCTRIRSIHVEIQGVLKSHTAERISEIDPKEAMEAIHNLKQTLAQATPQEVKTLLKDNIREIRIPKNGDALLKANPEGQMAALGYIKLVTPRGVEPPLPA